MSNHETIDAILKADDAVAVKQGHTVKRIFERLRDAHDLPGGHTEVKNYVRICRTQGRETFVPLAHPPDHTPVYCGETIAIVGGV